MPNLMNMTPEEVTQHLRTMAIAGQNDAFRLRMVGRGGPAAPEGRWLMTAAVADMGPDFMLEATRRIADLTADDFSEDIDPRGERDMGKVEVQGRPVWFKIDYYDAAFEYGSEDPASVEQTRRVLTIMFPEDY